MSIQNIQAPQVSASKPAKKVAKVATAAALLAGVSVCTLHNKSKISDICIQSFSSGSEKILKFIKPITNKVVDAVSGTVSKSKPILDKIATVPSKIISKAKPILDKIITTPSSITLKAKPLFDSVSSKGSEIIENVKPLIKNIPDSIVKFKNSITNFATNLITKGQKTVADAPEVVENTIEEFLQNS